MDKSIANIKETNKSISMNRETLKNNGFIVSVTCNIFNCLRQVSLFQQVRNITRGLWMFLHRTELQGKSYAEKRQLFAETKPFTNSYIFPELWVLGNIVIGIIIYTLLANYLMPRALGWGFVVLAILRAFEIIVYHVNVLLFDPLIAAFGNQQYAIKSATRMLLLLFCNMLEYVICFGIVYLFFLPTMDAAYWQSFALSVSAFLNINMEGINSIPNTLISVVRIESILGVFMNLICIARFINMLPSVNTIDKQ